MLFIRNKKNDERKQAIRREMLELEENIKQINDVINKIDNLEKNGDLSDDTILDLVFELERLRSITSFEAYRGWEIRMMKEA